MDKPVRVVNLVPAVVWGFGFFLAWSAVAQMAQPLLLIALAIIIAAGLNPIVVWAQGRLKLSRSLAAAIIMFIVLGGLFLLGVILVPTLVEQLASLVRELPGQVQQAFRQITELLERNPALAGAAQSLREVDLARQLQSILPGTLAGVLGATTGLFSGFLLGLVLFLLGFFVLSQPEPLLRGALSGVPAIYRDTLGRTLVRIGAQLGQWLIASVLLAVVLTVLVWLGLTILNLTGVRVQNAFLYAVIAGVTSIIPVIGPLIGLVPPVLANLVPTPAHALWVGLIVFVAQQVVFQVLTPIVYGRGVSLHPASLLGGVLLFGALFGVIGSFLAVPFLIITKALYEEVYLARLGSPTVSNDEVRDLLEGEAPDSGV